MQKQVSHSLSQKNLIVDPQNWMVTIGRYNLVQTLLCEFSFVNTLYCYSLDYRRWHWNARSLSSGSYFSTVSFVCVSASQPSLGRSSSLTFRGSSASSPSISMTVTAQWRQTRSWAKCPSRKMICTSITARTSGFPSHLLMQTQRSRYACIE